MEERILINAFDDCVARLHGGESLDSCLRAYPDYAAELRPLLLTSQALRQVHIDPAEVQAAQARGRAKVIAAMQPPTLTLERPARRSPYLRLVTLAASLILLLGVFFGGAAVATETSLPGDPLYGYKRFTEQVRVAISSNPQPLQEQFAQRRIDEIRQLQAINRAETVDFSGVVTAIDAGQWQVAGLALMVPEDTLGAHDIIISDVVAVQARTTSAGSLIAERITLIEPGNEPPVPTQNLTPTLSPTLTGTPTPTPTSTSPPPTLTFTVTPVTAQSGAAPDDGCVVDAPAGWVIYQVRSGDTLSSLAAQTSVPVEQLMQINCLDDAHLIVAGQSIWLPFDIAPPPTPLPARAGGGPDSGSRGSGGSHSDDGDDDDDD
ncbi:MAG TPA: LysM peptidoglycan-binding domain-containing protein [Spirillospora sp.]|nr:LysM peptidoglycan-binding domain-containing protein [Spirillospora sp.]